MAMTSLHLMYVVLGLLLSFIKRFKPAVTTVLFKQAPMSSVSSLYQYFPIVYLFHVASIGYVIM